MNIVLLRVGIDTGCGGIHSPLFSDGTFEFVPIPADPRQDNRTYGNTNGRKGRPFVQYFPKSRQMKMKQEGMHVDPEFETFTYGDPTSPKRSLAQLKPGDLLVFYAGMEGWDCAVPPALYLAGMFRVKLSGFSKTFTAQEIQTEFSENAHVRHRPVSEVRSEKDLVLIKGGKGSRLFKKAHLIGEKILRSDGTYWQVITPKMEKVFGKFGGIGSLQRSTPRWVEEGLIAKAEKFVESLS